MVSGTADAVRKQAIELLEAGSEYTLIFWVAIIFIA